MVTAILSEYHSIASRALRMKGITAILNLIVVSVLLIGVTSTSTAQIKGCDSPCNLIKNGSFNDGNVGFTSGLPMQAGACAAGHYCVGPLFKTECSSWPATGGHPGNFLIIDGSASNNNVNVWNKTVKTCIGVTYTFSFEAKNIFNSADGVVNVGMMIDGANKQTAAVTSTTDWQTFTYSFTATKTSYTLALQQLTAGAKRDFGIDNIFFGFCSCACTPD